MKTFQYISLQALKPTGVTTSESLVKYRQHIARYTKKH